MKKCLATFLLFQLFGGVSFGLSVKLDSLNALINNNKSGRVSAILDLAYNYVDSTNYYDFICDRLNEVMDSANTHDNDTLKVDACNYLGLADFAAGNYEGATSKFYQALNVLDESPNNKQEAKVCNNLGMIFDELEDYKQALKFYRKSFILDSLSNNERGHIQSYINFAITYQNMEKFDSCRYFNEMAYQLAQKYKDSLSIVNVVNNLGTLEYDLKNYDKSLKYYDQALQIYQKTNDQVGIAYALNNIGLIHLDQKEYPQALKNFKAALKIATDLNLYDFTGDIYSNLTIYYKEVGDYKNAYEYYDKYNVVYDSLVGEKQNKMIRKLETQYQFEKKQREILELKQENKHQRALIIDSKSFQHYLYLVIVLVGVFLAVLFFLLRKEKIMARQLKEKTDELKKLNIAKDRFFSIIAHDLKNPFNALVSYTSLLKADLDSFTKDELNQIITDLSNATEQGFSLLENLLYWTRSQTNQISVFKTFFSLQKVVDNVVSLAGPNLIQKSQSMEVTIEEDLELFADKDMIATVLRNLIFNSIKFSYSDTVIRIEGKRIDKNIQVSVIDQGVGIDAERQHKFFHYEENTSTSGTSGEQGSGLGLVICKEFIEKNEGVIWVESEPGKGATFRFSIPYVEKKDQ
ncbi:MAG TPA: tetratricopeptide repeat-containing sensor histidine kinase [Sunxiuqinia sp.]|nr:tetratricopeptide repeat-containing sensor histidine kinase [Sunxiuqinia sp.]